MSASETIKDLGGTRPAARLLGTSKSTVQSWKSRDNIPKKWAALIKEKTGILYKKEQTRA